MVQIVVMSIFCIFALVYGYGVVFKREWLTKLVGGKSKHNEQSTVNKMRQIMGMAALVLGLLGLIVNIALAYVLLQGSAI